MISYTERAIIEAEKGGWKRPDYGLFVSPSEDIPHFREKIAKWENSLRQKPTALETASYHAGYGEGMRDCAIFLDIEFWQALDKQMAEDRFLRGNIQDGFYQPNWSNLLYSFMNSRINNVSAEDFFKVFLTQ